MKVVIPDDYPPQFSGNSSLERLSEWGELTIHNTKSEDEEEFVDRMRHADAVITVRAYSDFNSKVLRSLDELKIISVSGTGTDNIDLQEAGRLGIVVANTPTASSLSVAEHTMALMFAAARAVAVSDRRLRDGKWEHTMGFELHGKTLGLIGLGRIGQHVAKVANAMGMNVLAWSFTRDEERAKSCGVEQVELSELLAAADVVSLHVRASERTRQLLGAEQLQQMKTSALLVNTARGSVVDEAALVNALSSGRIRGAALDVFESEPLPAEHPLTKLDNVVLTPHAGWVTEEANQRLIDQPIDNVLSFFDGHLKHIVNPEAIGKR